jgi:predicted DNA-binding transcriptional regulator AlpA
VSVLRSRREAAAFCGVSLPTFDQYVRPQLTAKTIGRRVLFRLADLEAWVESDDGAAIAVGKGPRRPIASASSAWKPSSVDVHKLPLTRGQRVRLGVATPDEVEIEAAIQAKRAARRLTK